MNHYAYVSITNYNDILSFARSLTQIPEFCKLLSDEKLKIIYSYPFIYKINKTLWEILMFYEDFLYQI